MDNVDLIYERMGLLAKWIFADANVIDHLEKLKQEVQEAKENPKDVTEFADCLLCLFAATNKAGFTYNELIEASRNKLFIVENRQWKKMPDGTYQHREPMP